MNKTLTLATAAVLVATSASLASAAPRTAPSSAGTAIQGIDWYVGNDSGDCTLTSGASEGGAFSRGPLGGTTTFDRTRTQTFVGTDPADQVSVSEGFTGSMETATSKAGFSKASGSGTLTQAIATAMPTSACTGLSASTSGSQGVTVKIGHPGSIRMRIKANPGDSGSAMLAISDVKHGYFKIVSAPEGSVSTTTVRVSKPGRYLIAAAVELDGSMSDPGPHSIGFSWSATSTKAGK